LGDAFSVSAKSFVSLFAVAIAGALGKQPQVSRHLQQFGENQNLRTPLQGLGNSQYDAASESLYRKEV
jgi:hypothetical protein